MTPGDQPLIEPAADARAKVRVEIGVLSLPSGTRARGAAVGAALRAELARLFASAGAQQRLRELTIPGGAASVLDAGHMRLRSGERAERLGARLAGQVADGLLGLPAARGRR